MKSMLSYFKFSFIFTAVMLAFGAALGWIEGGANLAVAYLISVAMLGILETSVSLDNAVVNAKYMEKMNERSKQWFLSWGMVIAVFGMRLLLPVAIVSLAAWVNPWEAVKLALFNPVEYEHHLHSVHVEIMGFGAGFLLMVALEFFFNDEKEHHWIPVVEHIASYIGKFPQIQILIAIPAIVAAGIFAPKEGQALMFSGFAGMLLYVAIHGVKDILEALEEEKAANMVADAAKLMIGSLVFLEILDASFSFDGVIAAFAITNNFLVIAAGLGVGAMFVRSLTVYLVEKGTMSELVYLEHGAFWGILWLVAAMTLSTYGVELGEVVVAGVAAAFIIVAGVHSVLVKEEEVA